MDNRDDTDIVSAWQELGAQALAGSMDLYWSQCDYQDLLGDDDEITVLGALVRAESANWVPQREYPPKALSLVDADAFFRELRAAGAVRRARKRSLPADFTGADYACAINYFHGVCAYCSNPPSMFDTNRILHADHFIPLTSSECPGTISANMVPACPTCNFQKHDNSPYLWVPKCFGKRRGAKILKNIEAYFAGLG